MISFSHPHYLWAFFALLLPLILHLLNRRQNRRIIFPTIRFLRKTALPREGRHQLQDLLLLLLRVILLGLFILLLADPRWQSHSSDGDGVFSRNILRLIILDQSASMQAPETGIKLRSIVDSRLPTSPDCYWGLIAYSSRARIVFSPKKGNLSAIRRYLNSAEAAPGFLKGNPDSALQLAAGLLKQFSGEKEVFILTDRQSSDWEKATVRLPRVSQLHFYRELSLPKTNASVQQVLSAPLQGNRIRLTVLLRNHGNSPAQRELEVRLGSQSQKQTVQIPANGQLPAVFIFEQKQPRIQGLAVLSPDALPHDDQFSFWSGHPLPEKVLLVVDSEESASSSPALNSYFLKQALITEQEGRFHQYLPHTLPASTLFAVNYSDYRQIFLLGTAEILTLKDWEKLNHFVKQGGLLFITPGNSPQTAFHLLQKTTKAGIKYQGTIGADSLQAGLGIGWIRPDSLIGKLFPEKSGSDLFLFPVRRYLHLEVPRKQNNSILLKTLDNRPALIEITRGLGKIYCFAFGFSPLWSDFALSQSFLPLIRELCSQGISHKAVSRKLYCGQPRPRYFQLNGEEIDKEKVIDTTHPQTASIGSHLLEIHPDPEESHTESSLPEALERFLQTSSRASLSPFSENAAVPDSTVPLRRYLAALIMIILLLEGVYMTIHDRKRIKGQ